MATNAIAVSKPRKTWIKESTMKKTTMPPTTTAPTFSKFMQRPLSTGLSSIIIRFGTVRAASTRHRLRRDWEGSRHAGTRDRHRRHWYQGSAGGPRHWSAGHRAPENRHPAAVHARGGH